MRLTDYLAEEWKLALGCTEPAAIAWAAAHAAALADGPVRAVRLVCDSRIYKNCYAVGIPNSQHQVGILWAIALGSLLPHPDAGLESFSLVTPEIIAKARELISSGSITVEVDATSRQLLIDCDVARAGGRGRARVERDHTRLVLLERDGAAIPLPATTSAAPQAGAPVRSVRAELAALPFSDLVAMAGTLSPGDRERLHEGARLNRAIAEHGLTLFPKPITQVDALDVLSRINRLVCAGVLARMSGEDYSVMSLAGSGNKGIVIGVSIPMFGESLRLAPEAIDEAMALACLFTSATTHHLGTLSAVCGCTNAAGIGLAAALVHLQGGDARQISLAVDNMVGNVTGMICDGAKMGCAMKTITAVDAAWRAAQLALGDVGIPASDGIVGQNGEESLRFLGRIANEGMASMDAQILHIMQSKLQRSSSGA